MYPAAIANDLLSAEHSDERDETGAGRCDDSRYAARTTVAEAKRTETHRQEPRMARIKLIMQREDVPLGGEDAFDRVITSRGSINAPQSILMHLPEVSALAAAMNDALRFGSSMSDADVELSILVAAREFDIAYVWSSHARRATELGVPQVLVDAIATGDALPADIAPRSALITRFARELVGRHTMTDDLFADAQRELGDRGVIELTALLGYYLMIGCALIAADYPVSPTAPALPGRPMPVNPVRPGDEQP